jgi:hypothetical protein
VDEKVSALVFYTNSCSFFGKIFPPKRESFAGPILPFPYPMNCCRSELSFMRFEVVFAVNIYILIFSVATACSLFVGIDITDESADCIFMVES